MTESQSASAVMMIRPVGFTANPLTASTSAFQINPVTDSLRVFPVDTDLPSTPALPPQDCGGGSVRRMLAEIFLPEKESNDR